MQVSPASPEVRGYNASKARKYAIEQMIARNEARRLAQSRESAVKKFNS